MNIKKNLFFGFIVSLISLMFGSCTSSDGSSSEAENDILKFTDPILESISGITPDYENDFTVEKSGLEEGGNNGTCEYIDGEYRFRVTTTADYAMSHTSGIIYNLVLKFKLRYLTGTENGEFYVSLQGSNDPSSNEGYHIHFKGDNNILIFRILDGGNNEEGIASKKIDLMHDNMSFIEIIIVAKDSKIAILIDSDPILLVEDAEYGPQFSSGHIAFFLGNRDTSDSVEAHIDDLKVWDVSHLNNDLNLKEIRIREMASPTTEPNAFVAQYVFSDDSTSDYSSMYTWSSSNSEVGEIDSDTGVFTIKEEGTTFVTAHKHGVISSELEIFTKKPCGSIFYGTAALRCTTFFTNGCWTACGYFD